MSLEAELAAYEANLPTLLAHEGSWCVVGRDGGHEGEWFLTYPFVAWEDALRAGYEKFGLGPFLVRQILKEQPIHHI